MLICIWPGRARPGGHPRLCRRPWGPWTCVCVACLSLPQPLLSVTCVTDVFWAAVTPSGQTRENSPAKPLFSIYSRYVCTENRPRQRLFCHPFPPLAIRYIKSEAVFAADNFPDPRRRSPRPSTSSPRRLPPHPLNTRRISQFSWCASCRSRPPHTRARDLGLARTPYVTHD